MPELPEVETMRRGIAAVAGCRITGLRRPRSRLQSIVIQPPLAAFRRRAVGSRIDAVGRVGKRIVLELDSGDRIILEPRMTGLVLLADPPDAAHLRLVFELSPRAVGDCPDFRPTDAKRRGAKMGLSPSVDTPAELLFWDRRGLGVARLLSPSQFHRLYGPDRVGPDALTVSAAVLRSRLEASRRQIKVALLDQRAVAGIGNLYASEILHRAGIHPALPCRRLRGPQWTALHAAIGEVLRAAIRHQGSTLRDGTYRIARNQPGNYQLCHWVYQRAGERCVRCGRGEVVQIVQCQRSTFFCPSCQARRAGD
jgi:formamidopyrimidine-DNA glycosylase